jgi:GntR family transcriptional regulator
MMEVMMPSNPFSKRVLISGQAKSAEINQGTANELECTRLRLRADETVYRIHRIRDHGVQIFLVEDVTLPAALFPGLAETEVIADHVGALAQEYGILLGKVEERISMSIPPRAVANPLAVASGTPVLLLDRVVFALDGHRPVEWRLAYSHLVNSY